MKKQKITDRRSLVQARVSTGEMQDAITKAKLYTNGNMSDLVRAALNAYRPIKKVGLK